LYSVKVPDGLTVKEPAAVWHIPIQISASGGHVELVPVQNELPHCSPAGANWQVAVQQVFGAPFPALRSHCSAVSTTPSPQALKALWVSAASS
jgi:hypothetical protein